jgi:acyl-CoA reductase-like NAD-dependent aldehyde dehydrogenase
LPALFLGNTVVLKPSKQTPATAQMLCEAIMQAGFPAGVVNMIQGDKETARRLAQNSAVNVVLFTGPYELGNQIKRDTVDPVDKTLVMETGGKNVSIVWDGADLPLAQRMILEGAYITGGQRSTATSRLIIQRKLAPEFLENFHLLAKQLVIGNPFNEEPTPFMGALIHPISVERYLKFQGIAIREGCECLMRGKAFENAGTTGHYVTPSIYIVKDHSPEKIYKSIFQQTELFGPCLSVYMVDSLDEAVAVANTVDYGLTASVFADQQTAKYFWQKLNFGNLHWNLPTTYQDVALPFGGVRKSGNGTFTGYQLAASLVRPVGGVWSQGGAADPLPGLSD